MNIINKQENNMEQQTIAQLEQNVAELLAKAEEMKQLIEKAKKEQTWPNYGDAYWYALGNGHVYRDCWENTINDLNRQKFGNIHNSRSEAEDYVQKRIVQVELEQLAEKAWKARGTKIDWKNKHQDKWDIFYDNEYEKFKSDFHRSSQALGAVSFPTQQSVHESIKTIGEERLKVLVK